VDIDDDGAIAAAERLNPAKKDLFVQGSGFGGAFPDFAWGNAFAEAQINLHEFEGTVGTDDRNIDVLVVSAADEGDHILRLGPPLGSGVRNWDFATLGSSNVGNGTTYGANCKVMRKSTNYYFSDRPHDDGNTWTAAAQWNNPPNGVLDPVNPERVEDTNDNGGLDANENNGAASAPNDDADGNIDGDHPVPAGASWSWTQDLSPVDIDNDGKVECPRDNQVPVPDADEYTKAQVVHHVTTHEMGHAVGINGPYAGHCNDSTCLMYRWTNNWSRDGHFCNDCRGMILIHNK